jgi:tetratricopeptide (TPR) repeat protein
LAADVPEQQKNCEGGKTISADFQYFACTALIQRKPALAADVLARAYFLRGQVAFARGQLEAADKDLSEALKRSPSNPVLLTERAKVRFYLKKFAEAIADAGKAIALDPKSPDAFYHRANAHFELQDYDRALADYNLAIELNPDFAFAYADRGITQLRRENFDAAIADIEKSFHLAKRRIPWAAQQLEEAKAARAALAQRRSSLRSIALPKRRPSPSAQEMTAGAGPSAGTGGEAVDDGDGEGLGDAPLLKTRVALVIGNSAYQNISVLKNSVNDARDVAEALTKAKFEVFGYPTVNMTRKQMFDAIKAFQAAAARADTAFVWYAGHGQEFEIGGDHSANWLIPVDFEPDGDILEGGVPLSRLMTAASPARTLRVVVIDACRNSDLPSRTRGARGFRVEARTDMLIVYSTRAGSTADDGGEGSKNSPFAAAFLESFGKSPKLDVRLLFGGVARGTAQRTKPAQEPEKIDRLKTEAILALAP